VPLMIRKIGNNESDENGWRMGLVGCLSFGV
jgi:hypothetical protein